MGSVLKGKEKKISADPLSGAMNDSAGFGMDYYRRAGKLLHAAYSQPTDNIVNQQIGMENKLIRGAGEDSLRSTDQLVGQRGMGSSSIGLGIRNNVERSLAEKLAMNNASRDMRQRDMRIDALRGRMGAGEALMKPKLSQGPVQMNTVKYRTGGLAGVIGGAAGAYFGGPAGAQAGLALGNAYANS